MSGAPDTLATRNLAALAAVFPDLHDAIVQLGEPAGRLTGSLDGGDLDLDLGHALFYGGDAGAFARDQVTAFLKAPGRFYMEPPLRTDSPYQQQHFVSETLHRHFEGRPLNPLPVTPTPEGGFLLVYGIGLGLFVPTLVEGLPVRHIVMIEEHLDFFRHSLDVVDWAALLDRIVEAGQTLHFIFGSDAGVVASRVHWFMRGAGFGLLDGSYLYRHYRSTLLDHAHAEFVKTLPLLPISIGFFEDEEVMIQHCTENLLLQDFLYMDIRKRLAKDVPAFIVGSGPSLDRTIEQIRRLSSQAVIFSCGSGLQPLLRAGIRPDFHCELENGLSSLDHVQRAAAAYGLSGITLIASTTVHTKMPALFDDCVMYFRDSVSSTPLWCPDQIGIHGTAPTCTNLALRAALILAFREIYLFGVDLGTRDPSDHHAAGVFYDDRPDLLAEIETDPVRAMTIELPGNFGGKAYTNTIMHWARMMMAQSIEAFSFATIYNCSDGVTIPGTRPKLAQTIRSTVPPGRKAVVLGRMRRELDAKRAGEMAPLDHLRGARAALAQHYRDMLDEIATSRAEGIEFIPFYERIERLLVHRKPNNPFQTLLRAVNIGMVMMSVQIGYYFYRRAEPAEQPVVMQVFLDALAERLRIMAAAIDARFGHLDTFATRGE